MIDQGLRPEAVTFQGGDGDEAFTATTDIDHIDGGGGNDRIEAKYHVHDTSLPGRPLYSTVNPGDQFIGGSGSDLLLITSDVYDRVDLTQVQISGIETIRYLFGSAQLTYDQISSVFYLYGDFYVTGSGSYTQLGGRLQGNLTLGDGNDVASLAGGTGAASIHGGGGDDTLTSGNYAENNAVYGDDGNDTLIASGPGLYGTVGAKLNGGAGNDTLTGGELSDSLFGGPGLDIINGNGGDDRISLDPANGPAEADQISGGSGTDTLYVRTGYNNGWTLDLGIVSVALDVERIDAPDAIVRGSSSRLAQFQSVKAGIVQFTDAADANAAALSNLHSHRFELGAAGGSLDLSGLGDAYQLIGNSGDDRLTGGSGDDQLFSGSGTDRLIGGNGIDGLYFGASYGAGDGADGGAGTDTLALQGNYAALTLTGMSNVEILLVASGSDSRFGDTAGNAYDYRIATVDSNIAAGGMLTVIATDLGTSEDLAFDGSAESDGAFRIFAGRGTDDLRGGAGGDGFFFGSDGNLTSADHVDGGAGTDTLALRGDYSGADAVAFAAGSFTHIEVLALLSAHTNEYSGKIFATGFDYDLVLADANLAAGETLQVIGTGLGTDESLSLDGRAETDGILRILSGAGDDILYGGSGGDTLYGGLGADRLDGGAGADTYVYRAVQESTAASRDTIAFGAGDRIDLSVIDANSATAANDAFTFIGDAAFGHVAGELRAFQTNGQWFVEGDVNGDGTADLVLALASSAPIVSTDFIL